MARLNYTVEIQGQNNPSNDGIPSITRYIRVRIPTSPNNNVAGSTPQVRLGLGAWENITIAGGEYLKTWSGLTAGTSYDLWYKDDRGERLLASCPVLLYAGSCFSGTGAVTVPSIVQVQNGSVVLSSGVSMGGSIYPFQYGIGAACGSGPWQSSGAFAVAPGTDTVPLVCRRTALGCSANMAANLYTAEFNPISIGYTKTDVTINGGNNGSIDVTPSGGSGVYTYLWLDNGSTSQDRTGLVAGTYNVRVMSGGLVATAIIQINEPDQLRATYTKTNCTANGVNDGTISVMVTGGSGVRTISWNDSGSTAFNRTGLAPGFYLAEINDPNTGEMVTLEITITEPTVEIPEGSYMEIPLLNFVRCVLKTISGTPVTPNGYSTFQNFDSTLFCEEQHPYYKHENFLIPVGKYDANQFQWFSDFPSHDVQLINYNTGALVKAFNPEMKMQLIGQSEEFAVTLSNHGSGKTRVYFGVGSIPIPLAVGDTFEIINNADGFNGPYEIVAIQNDLLMGSQYLVINVNYAIVSPSSSADAVFTTNVVDFNVFESVINLADVPDGQYQLKIVGFSDNDNYREWWSEPMNVAAQLPDTNVIEYRCNDNAFDMVWTTGITVKKRVTSILHNRFVGGSRNITRNCEGSIIKTASKKTRRPILEIFQIPAYEYEKLQVAMDCDVIKVNGVQYQTDQDMDKPKYTPRYRLANTSVELEQIGWFKTYNSQDVGNVDGQGGFIIANQGFLKR